MPAFVHAPFMSLPTPPSATRRSPVSVKQVSTNQELAAALSVRQRVFVDELGIPPTEEFDRLDGWPLPPSIQHFLITVEQQPIATCRINHSLAPAVMLEHMAVLKVARRKGVGIALVNHLERIPSILNSRGPLFCYAIKDTQLFYLNSGWVVEDGHSALTHALIPHVAMVRRRRPPGARVFGSPTLSHVMVRTSDIARARRFYSLFGFEDVSRFNVNGVRGVWIESPYIETKIELLEMAPKSNISAQNPDSHFSNHNNSTPSIGTIGHISLDVSRACTSLTRFLNTIQRESIDRFKTGLRVLERPRQMTLASLQAEVTFISDADGTVLELMRFVSNADDDIG